MAADREVQAEDQVVREAAAVFEADRECPHPRAEDGAVMVIRAEDAAAFRFFASLR